MSETTTYFKASRGILAMLWVVAAGIVLYWIDYFTGVSVIATEDVCYHVFQRNFPAPDGMISLMCILCAEGLRRGREWAIFTGMTAVGGLLFLALIDISFNLWNGIYSNASNAISVELIINVVCLTTAAVLARYLWSHRTEIPKRK